MRYKPLRLNNLDADDIIMELKPRAGEYTLRTDDILSVIEEHRLEIALIMMGGVNYYTGQCFDMATITKAGKKLAP